MTRRFNSLQGLGVTTVSAVLLLAGCSSAGQGGGGMMGNGARSSGGAMGGAQGYHYSRLSCSAPARLPGATVQVRLADMGMTRMMGGDAPMGSRMSLSVTPRSAPAGSVSFVASNVGWRTHELVVMPVAGQSAAGERVPGPDGRIAEGGSAGEASAPCAAGSGEGITSGAVGWVTLTLAPGRYELVCNLKNHYANGMHEEFDVR
ncbi:hypothetical protein ABEG17_18000 [Pedococcus sp. KACC 23699]|uniref:Blue (type 1) copper domain-containing protein n=1 Tax=Pedococcus sp. KACC 23699 TaxID=3149228 RepID=A0AAU7JU81_9MICO